MWKIFKNCNKILQGTVVQMSKVSHGPLVFFKVKKKNKVGHGIVIRLVSNVLFEGISYTYISMQNKEI